MHKILIIEDDMTIAEAVSKHLSKWDFDTKYITDFKDIAAKFIEFDPQLVLLDITLPFFNGYHWCKELRKISKVPIIFISSASDSMNIVMAMNMGGDDFITKPFDLTVLTAKVQALLRRSYSFGGQLNVIQHGEVMLDLNNSTLRYREEKLELTRNDFKILQILLENVGKIVSRDAIMIKLWENDNFIDDNTLTVNITRLRKKLESIGLDNFIITKKGSGYVVS